MKEAAAVPKTLKAITGARTKLAIPVPTAVNEALINVIVVTVTMLVLTADKMIEGVRTNVASPELVVLRVEVTLRTSVAMPVPITASVISTSRLSVATPVAVTLNAIAGVRINVATPAPNILRMICGVSTRKAIPAPVTIEIVRVILLKKLGTEMPVAAKTCAGSR
jgi:hypothetical protein